MIGLTEDLFFDHTTGPWENWVIEAIQEYWGKPEIDRWLRSFLQVMKYLRTFFPEELPDDAPAEVHLPFTVTVCQTREEFRAECLRS